MTPETAAQNLRNAGRLYFFLQKKTRSESGNSSFYFRVFLPGFVEVTTEVALICGETLKETSIAAGTDWMR